MTLRANIRRTDAEWWLFECTLYDNNGTPLDLSSIEALDWLVSKERDGAALLTASLGSGVTVVDAPAGRADILVTRDDHAILDPGRYFHECNVTLAGGEVQSQFSGALNIEPSIASAMS